MHKKLTFLLVFIICLFLSFNLGVIYSSNDAKNIVKLNSKVKKLLSEPVENSKPVYDIPVEITVTGRTEDFRWYKVKVAYNFFGYFEYEGWCKVN